MNKGRRVRRVEALDGLRTLAIVAILLYHLNLGWLPSGHMGVVVFLVLSGYFSTNAIVRICERKSKNRVRGIIVQWFHRIRRIWPSVLALIACSGTVFAVLNQVLLTKMRPDVLPALGFFLNWSYILNGVSYFQRIGGPSPLLHLWYLGVDMQFFLVWSIVLPLALKGGKRFARLLTLVLALLSAAWMAWLYVPNADPSRIYYGTDTRAFSLLLGALVALALPLGNREAYAKSPFGKGRQSGGHGTLQVRPSVLARIVGLLSITSIGAAMALLPANSIYWYWGGMFGLSVLSALLIATLLVPKTVLGTVLGCTPLRTLGQRAFALYLWHYPIFLFLGATKSTTEPWIRLAAVGASMVAAELSLRLVERPFGPQRTPKAQRQAQDVSPARKSGTVITALSIYALAVYAGYALLTSADVSLVPQEALVSTGQAAGQAMDLSAQRTETKTQNTRNASKAQKVSSRATAKQDDTKTSKETTPKETTSKDKKDPEAEETPAEEAPEQDEEYETVEVAISDRTVISAPESEVSAGTYDPVLIGDSVPGDAGDEFVPNGGGWQSRLPNALVDTYIGRNPLQSLDVLKGYLDQKVVGHVVVMACFSNSTPYPETLDTMVEAAGPDRSIYLVGTVNPDGFQDAANANLQDAANRYENVHYVDWPAILDGHLEEYLWADATHLRPQGAQVYVNMIVHAVAQDLVDAGGSISEF